MLLVIDDSEILSKDEHTYISTFCLDLLCGETYYVISNVVGNVLADDYQRIS
jgi:hypothetical protein